MATSTNLPSLILSKNRIASKPWVFISIRSRHFFFSFYNKYSSMRYSFTSPSELYIRSHFAIYFWFPTRLFVVLASFWQCRISRGANTNVHFTHRLCIWFYTCTLFFICILHSTSPLYTVYIVIVFIYTTSTTTKTNTSKMSYSFCLKFFFWFIDFLLAFWR